MRRQASMPLMPGRLMSMSTRSGWREPAISTASSPDTASPATTNPSVMPITVRATSRNGCWSSTISTETVFVDPSGAEVMASTMVTPSVRRRQEVNRAGGGVLATPGVRAARTPCSAGLFSQEQQHRLDPAVHVDLLAEPELREQRVDVLLDRVGRQEQRLRDARVVAPLRHLLQDLALARSEAFQG